MINGNWQATRGGFVAMFPGDLQAQIVHIVGPISECWIWQIGRDDVEIGGEKDTEAEALEAAEAAVREMMEAEGDME